MTMKNPAGRADPGLPLQLTAIPRMGYRSRGQGSVGEAVSASGSPQPRPQTPRLFVNVRSTEEVKMVRLLVALLLVVSGSSACLGQNSQKYRTCNDKAGGQRELTVCASEEAGRAEADLKEV